MIYLQSRTILVSIRELKQENNQVNYLVGEAFYATLPSEVTNNAFLSANWNRALKYGQNLIVDNTVRLGYYKMNFDLYYDEQNQELKVLTKNSFDQQIVQQKHFSSFLNQVVLANNKYKQNYSLKIPNELWTTQLVNIHQKHQLPITNFTHFVVNDDFDVDQVQGKYKYLIRTGLTTNIEITKHQQVIYTYNLAQINLSQTFSYLSLENNMVYLNGILALKNYDDLKLMINYEDPSYVLKLKTAILEQFETFLNDSPLKWIHFFNLTGELKYLETELKSYQTLSYSAMIEQLNFKFDQTKSNHYPLIFQLEELRSILFNSIQTLTELEEFNHQAKRFGILLKNEILAIEKKFLELR